MASNKIKEITLYSGAGNGIATDYVVPLHYPNGYGRYPVLYVQAVGGTGACAFFAIGAPSATVDGSILAVENRLGMMEPAQATSAETQNVTTAVSPGTKRVFYISSICGPVSSPVIGVMSDYLIIDVGTNTWNADVVALVQVFLYGG